MSLQTDLPKPETTPKLNTLPVLYFISDDVRREGGGMFRGEILKNKILELICYEWMEGNYNI